MKDYVILTDTGCDLESSLREKYNIELVCMHYIINGVDRLVDLDWKEISAKEYYQMMRDGTRITTAQVNQEDYRKVFINAANAGKDVLYVACSSVISAGINTARIIAEEVKKDYPDLKVVCVDALRACYALGILAITASKLRAEGKTIEETAAWLDENKLTVNMEGSVAELTYLKRAGRVSAASAFFGGLLNIKPIIMADARGYNFAIEKVKGRTTSLNRVAERFAEQYVESDYQEIFISHADCIEDAETLKKLMEEKLGKTLNVHIGYVGPGVGASVGPGMIGVYFIGKKVTVNQDK